MCDAKRIGRREVLSVMGAAGAALAWGCAESPTAPGGTTATTTTTTLQIAFPGSISNLVHATAAYGSRGSNPTTNLGDNIFADSLASELVVPVGDPVNGYAATFQIGIAI